MRNALLLQEYLPSTDQLDQVTLSLRHIQSHLLQELSYKQDLVEAKDQEIKELKAALDEKARIIEALQEKVLSVERNNEGNKQLNKKLISEIVRKQQDIEWYKRTYESRSLLGTLKEKIFGGMK